MMVHVNSPGPQEAETGGSRKFQGQRGLPVILAQKINNNTNTHTKTNSFSGIL
jgi:hypothetical protein